MISELLWAMVAESKPFNLFTRPKQLCGQILQLDSSLIMRKLQKTYNPLKVFSKSSIQRRLLQFKTGNTWVNLFSLETYLLSPTIKSITVNHD